MNQTKKLVTESSQQTSNSKTEETATTQDTFIMLLLPCHVHPLPQCHCHGELTHQTLPIFISNCLHHSPLPQGSKVSVDAFPPLPSSLPLSSLILTLLPASTYLAHRRRACQRKHGREAAADARRVGPLHRQAGAEVAAAYFLCCRRRCRAGERRSPWPGGRSGGVGRKQGRRGGRQGVHGRRAALPLHRRQPGLPRRRAPGHARRPPRRRGATRPPHPARRQCAGGSRRILGRRAQPRRPHRPGPAAKRAVLGDAGGPGALLPQIHRALHPDGLPLRLRPRSRPPCRPRRRRWRHRTLRGAAPPHRPGVARRRGCRRFYRRIVPPRPPARRRHFAIGSWLQHKRVRRGGHGGSLRGQPEDVHRLGRRGARRHAPRTSVPPAPPRPARHGRPALLWRPGVVVPLVVLVLRIIVIVIVILLLVRRRRGLRQQEQQHEAREAAAVDAKQQHGDGAAAVGGCDRVPSRELAGGGHGAGNGASRHAGVGGG